MSEGHPSSPQAREMADESMVRNLAAQAEAIWWQEKPIFLKHPAPKSIVDVGCGTGEITARLSELYPQAAITGVDLEESHLERARKRAPRARFEKGDAMALQFGDAQFDLAVCRHLIQAVPDARKVIQEMVRVVKPGGRLHLIAEDYGMLLAHPTALDSDGFWQRVPREYGKSIGVDLYIGRKIFTIFTELGLKDIDVQYIQVDTVRVPRDTFARIWEAWRDGYTETIVQNTTMPREEIERRWKEMITAARDPKGYALWQVPVWTASK